MMMCACVAAVSGVDFFFAIADRGVVSTTSFPESLYFISFIYFITYELVKTDKATSVY